MTVPKTLLERLRALAVSVGPLGQGNLNEVVVQVLDMKRTAYRPGDANDVEIDQYRFGYSIRSKAIDAIN